VPEGHEGRKARRVVVVQMGQEHHVDVAARKTHTGELADDSDSGVHQHAEAAHLDEARDAAPA
jgi:hypothetical protein